VSDLTWGLSMTVAGMGLVFGLLALMWALLSLVLRFDRPPPAAAPAAEPAPEAAPAPGDDGIGPELAAAIAVAVLAHVAALRREAAPTARSYWPGSQLFASRWVAIGRVRQNRSWRRKDR